jgi:hypothetical protein
MRLSRRGRARRLALTLSAATLGVIALTVPASVLAAPSVRVTMTSPAARPDVLSAVAGYLWSADLVQPPSGSIESYYAYDSASHGSRAVTVKHLSTGAYQVDFAGLGGVAGSAIVQVTTYSGADDCSAGPWTTGSNPTDLRAYVYCFGLTGAAADTEFNLVVTRPTSPPHGIFDYAFVSRATSSGPLTGYQYNSSRKKNSVTHLSAGHYRVLLGGPKLAGPQGVVKVSAYGDQPGDCQLASWSAAAPGGEAVKVNCYDIHHHAQNRQFMVTYTTGSSLLGINGQVVASAFANGKSPLYQPAQQYDSKHAARVYVAHLSTGYYEVLAVGSGGDPDRWGGNIQISSVGTKGQLCVSGGWSTGAITPTLYVRCFDRHDDVVDTPFTVEWVTP